MKQITKLDVQPLFAFLLETPSPDGYKITEFISRLWPELSQRDVYNLTQLCKAIIARLALLPKTHGVAVRTTFVRIIFKQNPNIN